MANLTDEVKRQAIAAWENKHDTFICFATGNTYPIREDLKSWAFQWNPEDKSWTLECCSAWDRFLFERRVADGKWPGVRLEFKAQDSIISREAMEQFKKDLEEKP